jgi:hypothetical protein
MVHLATMLTQCGESGLHPSESTPGAEEVGAATTLVIDLCNRLHQLSRTVEKAKEQGAAEADRLRSHLSRLAKTLGEHFIDWEDLTGQAYDPGRSDFEPLGEPQLVPGLARKTIIQCERPVIRFKGKVAQSARGVIGKPPS